MELGRGVYLKSGAQGRILLRKGHLIQGLNKKEMVCEDLGKHLCLLRGQHRFAFGRRSACGRNGRSERLEHSKKGWHYARTLGKCVSSYMASYTKVRMH